MTRDEILSIAKPILFNTEMVRAILNGRKTQTRRMLKLKYREDEFGFQIVTRKNGDFVRIEKTNENESTFFSYGKERWVYPPYMVGDYLYVRETWAIWSPTEGTVPKFHYRADNEALRNVVWKPSIHMPKEAARIFIRITNIRVQRLQDIDDDGVVAEGLEIGAPFDELWDSTVKRSDRDKYGWNANPWVWVYEFERVVPE